MDGAIREFDFDSALDLRSFFEELWSFGVNMNHRLNGFRRFGLWSGVAAVLIASMFGQTPSAPKRGKIIPLSEITSVSSVRVSGDRIYIADGRSREIFVYALDDFRLIRKIGRAGQGPGEFESPPQPIIFPNELAVKSFSKIVFFSKEGEFRREIKIVPADLMFSGFPVFPLGRGYAGFPFIRDERGRMISCVGRIYDENWKPTADFADRFPSPTPSPPPPPGAKITGPKEDDLLIKDYCAGWVEGERIYFADSRKGFSISVFDAQGAKIREIRQETTPVRIERKYRENLIAEWREERKKDLDRFNPVVPDVFPSLFAFRVDGEEILAVTPQWKDGLYEIITMNLEGTVLRRSFSFPLEPSWDHLPSVNSHFDIHGGILYTTAYNEDQERIELSILPIK